MHGVAWTFRRSSSDSGPVTALDLTGSRRWQQHPCGMAGSSEAGPAFTVSARPAASYQPAPASVVWGVAPLPSLSHGVHFLRIEALAVEPTQAVHDMMQFLVHHGDGPGLRCRGGRASPPWPLPRECQRRGRVQDETSSSSRPPARAEATDQSLTMLPRHVRASFSRRCDLARGWDGVFRHDSTAPTATPTEPGGAPLIGDLSECGRCQDSSGRLEPARRPAGAPTRLG